MLAKSDEASTSDKTSPLSPTLHESSSEAPPPAYDTVSPGLGSLPPSMNYVSIFKKDGSIKGTWSIDSSLQVPVDLLSPIADGAERHHLSLQSRDGGLAADVALLSNGPERASIFLHTRDGNIKLALICRKNDQPFKAQLKTHDGSISIEIPRSFTGPIKHSSASGKCEFSKGVRENLRASSTKISFLGSWEGSGFSNFETWKGDEIEATTLDGTIKVKYNGEVEGDTKKKFPWF